ncbi:MAG: hypothetical protein MJD61_03470 [Proteobacteria bacterium]|nr:hypothetical protein [Pseudomonadota bacterium]
MQARPRSYGAITKAAVALVGAGLGLPVALGQHHPAAGDQLEWTHPTPYRGVVPGADHRPPGRARPGVRPNLVTWPGFQVSRTGATRLFVQTSRPARFSSRQQAGRLLLTMTGVRVAGNNRNVLDCRYFNTPVDRASWKRSGRNLLLEIELRVDVQPTIYQRTGPAGYHFLFVEFPKGDYPKRQPRAPARYR